MNIFKTIPKDLTDEIFETIVDGESIKIERIISLGHRSPEEGWYDQNLTEWVIVLQGEAKIQFDNNDIFHLTKGDYLTIEAHQKHKVVWTEPDIETIWLAIHF